MGRVGSQAPRVRSGPVPAGQAAADALELAASVGVTPDPWQADEIRHKLAEGPSGRWAAFECATVVSRQNGKGTLMEIAGLAKIVLFGSRLILQSAHEFKTCNEAFLRTSAYFENYDWLRKRVRRIRHGTGEKTIELKNGVRWHFMARKGGTGRGFTGDDVFMDEAFNLDAAPMAAMLPTLSARPNPQLWYLSSAGWDISSQLAAVRRRGLSAVLGSPGLAYSEWSLDETAPYDRTDPNNWYATNPGMGIRITEEAVRRECEAMREAPELFDRERLGIGQWPAAPGAQWLVVSADQWGALLELDSAAVDPVTLAVDVNPARTRASIAAAGAHPSGAAVHVELVESAEGTDWLAGRVAQVAADHRAATVVIDKAGPAGAVAADIEAKLAGTATKVRYVTATEYQQACGAFVLGCTDSKKIRHRDQPRLASALANADQTERGSVWVWTRARGSSSDVTPLVAVTLAAWGHTITRTGNVWAFWA